MWELISRFILRYRLFLLIALVLLTLFMGYNAKKVKLSYEYAQLLPSNDPDFVRYREFRNIFGEDGSVIVIGVKNDKLFDLETFNAWYELGNELKKVSGVQEVVSLARIFNITKNTEKRKFEFKEVFDRKPRTQEELDSLLNNVFNLPFYQELLYNPENKATLMALTLDRAILNSEARIPVVEEIKELTERFSQNYNIKLHYSGLPYIRTVISAMVASELELFLMMAALVTAVILFLFFRSVPVVVFCMIVVGIGVIWSLGTMSFLGYDITLLTGLIPPLIIVIGVPNCIYLLNKYQIEYINHGNKIKALARTIERIGRAALMTNATTAIGFVAFTITRSNILREFGVVASINIILVFMLSLILIPVIFSFLPPPSQRHTKHLKSKRTNKMVEILNKLVHTRRKVIYFVTAITIAVGLYGITKIKSAGFIVDDLSEDHPIYMDLKFFESNFRGVMPFEISIDTKKRNGVMNLGFLRKIDELQDMLNEYGEFSKPVSLAEVVKFATQAYYNGNPARYQLPNEQERNFVFSYIPRGRGENQLLKSFVDSTRQITRVSVQMADVGSVRMEKLREELRPRIDSIFDEDDYDITLTGTSLIFLKGTQYLVDNLIISVALAILVITILMALMFMSFRMVLVSLIPNVIPLLFTAALMGYLGINLKPSTILIFSIAFGISVDNTIHFLAKYRQELRFHKWNISKTVGIALRETGVSMIYTSIVLFFGFSIFTASNFGGTVALGLLVSITLLVAVISNLLVLPSLLLSLEKSITAKAMMEPLIQIYDEEEDIELEDLEIKRKVNKE
jgi:uncharacterized protein